MTGRKAIEKCTLWVETDILEVESDGEEQEAREMQRDLRCEIRQWTADQGHQLTTDVPLE